MEKVKDKNIEKRQIDKILNCNLTKDNIFFAPVRHHSPSCAFALKAAIEDLDPELILIESPIDTEHLIPFLQSDKVVPPVAFFSTSKDISQSEHPVYSFFPFCEYSPEWVAIKTAGIANIDVGFIDVPTSARKEPIESNSRNLLSESMLAHSRYMTALGKELNCRNFNETWDKLFETRSLNSLREYFPYFMEIFTYCSLSRSSYTKEALEAGSDLFRETHMISQIQKFRKKYKGKIIVVTGGFHTPALLEKLHDDRKTVCYDDNRDNNHQVWLIPYSFDRLDSLSGYGAGMASPKFYQTVWESMNDEDEDYLFHSVNKLLTNYATEGRKRRLDNIISTADVQNGCEQALRLAILRDKSGPGRSELIDAYQSCFTKDTLVITEIKDFKQFLGGVLMGKADIKDHIPPILYDAREKIKKIRISVNDTILKRTRLDLYRKKSHRKKSSILMLFSYLNTGFAKRINGPDFMSLEVTHLLFEEWEYAWSPLVEAVIIELAPYGQTIEEVAGFRLRNAIAKENEKGNRSGFNLIVRLITQSILFNLSDEVDYFINISRKIVMEDTDPVSLINGMVNLCALLVRKELFEIPEGRLEDILTMAWRISMAMLRENDELNEESCKGLLYLLPKLHDISRLTVIADNPAQYDLYKDVLLFLYNNQMNPEIEGGSAALCFIESLIDDEEFGSYIKSRFGFGADSEKAIRAFQGIISICPESLTKVPCFIDNIISIIDKWDEQQFLSFLPDLRSTFENLDPMLIDEIAYYIKKKSGNHKIDLLEISADPKEIKEFSDFYNTWKELIEYG